MSNNKHDLQGDNEAELKVRGGVSKRDLKRELEDNMHHLGGFIDEDEFNYLIPSKVAQIQTNSPLNLSEEVWKYDLHKNLVTLRPVRFNDSSDSYYGQWSKDLRPEGEGVYVTHHPRQVHAGLFKQGELVRGRVFYPNGSYYEGETKRNVPHGDGKLYDAENPYEGQWVDGLRSGSGVIEFEDGVRVDGKFSENNLTWGKIVWTDGSEYEGDVTNQQLGLKGIFTTPKKNFYEGEWADNKMHGRGTFNWVGTNNVYEGNYVNGRKEGDGKYYFSWSDTFYQGKWLHDKPHGRGELHTKEKILVGLFRYGKLVQVFSEATLGGNDNGQGSTQNVNEIVLKKEEENVNNLVFLKEDVNTRYLPHLRRSEEDSLPNSPSKKYKPVGAKNYNYQGQDNVNHNYNQDLKKIRDGETGECKKEEICVDVNDEEKKDCHNNENNHCEKKEGHHDEKNVHRGEEIKAEEHHQVHH